MPNRILAALFRRIHQLIRALNQHIHRGRWTGEGRDADTEGHWPVLLVHGVAQALAHALHRIQRHIDAGFDEADNEFIAAQAPRYPRYERCAGEWSRPHITAHHQSDARDDR